MSIAIDGILETSLYADDLDAADAFYADVLGLERLTRVDSRHVFFRCGSGMLLIFNPAETQKPPASDAIAVPAHGARGPGHACFRVAGPALDGVRQRLAEAGVTIESEVHWPNGTRSFYFRDPAGNSLECAEPALWGLE
ncbi:VOC family protein [Rhizobium halophytocola]|uniref:Catechol 2,3-dioxygenase-like lactoylglutathione lyase family enzyme n=1 Tax=Rhizobium halophytocola TaxID=735519 RepID=A0ABS4E001_9HYPH|nr:VOC family protein [Rhizobium halophytocola]MBP1851271.1 catechol 2,3-dioxygenase-like lactoylglutathione lyase family enzyme [Rhizobium halophytocola]